jgi:hypothetical protein
METQIPFSRRLLVKSTILGVIAASVPHVVYSENITAPSPADMKPDERYPAIQLSVAAEVVGVAHFNLDRLKQLVDARPELAKATWDWAFGDWESAIAAASHVGRKDIVEYLLSKGAVPTIFTCAMLGQFETVKAMINANPGIQKAFGPHGISLLQHARTGLDNAANKAGSQQLIDYLESLGNADGPKYLEVSESDKAKYIGDYKYGDGAEDGFSIKLNMRKMISLGKLGKSGGGLFRTGENEFTYQGAPSVIIKFLEINGKINSLTLNEPGLILKATRI